VKRTLATIATVIALADGAAADSAPLVKAPEGWAADPEQASSLATKANAVSHLGVDRSVATADVYVSPSKHAALFVTGVAAKVNAEDRDAAARVAVDELHDATRRATLAGTGIVVDSWETRTLADTKEVQGALLWRDTKATTHTQARIVIAADDENMVAVTGECVLAGEASARDRADCGAALGTLDPGIPAAKRVPFSLAAEGTRPAEPMTLPSGRPPATMDDGSRAPLPPMHVAPQTPTTDRRPVYVGIGLVVLAAVFWWNQRRRARFDKEEDTDE
jgi:hypothetical protein